MGFDASKIEALDFDFTSFPGSTGQVWAIRGTVPEPTAAGRDAFTAEMAATLDLGGASTEDQVRQALAVLSPERQQEISVHLRGAVARLCAGTPSAEVLEAMPARLFDAFRDWLMEELLGVVPTVSPAALNGSRATAVSAGSPTA